MPIENLPRRPTARESSILHLVGRGLPQKVVADELGISVWTVRSHCRRLLRKLQANNVAHALTILARMEQKRQIDQAIDALRLVKNDDRTGQRAGRAILFCLILDCSELPFPIRERR